MRARRAGQLHARCVEARPDGGFFVPLTLPEVSSPAPVRAEAAKRNLNLSDGLLFPNGGGRRALSQVASVR
jgi:hypothetical protein